MEGHGIPLFLMPSMGLWLDDCVLYINNEELFRPWNGLLAEMLH